MNATCDRCNTGDDLQLAPNHSLTLCRACRGEFAKRDCGDCGQAFGRFAHGCENTMHNWLGYRS